MRAQFKLNQEIKNKIVEMVRAYAQLQLLKRDNMTVEKRCPYTLYSEEGQKWIKDSWRRLSAGIKKESCRLHDMYDAFGIDYTVNLLPLLDDL